MERVIDDEVGVAVVFDKREEWEEVKEGFEIGMSQRMMATTKRQGQGQAQLANTALDPQNPRPTLHSPSRYPQTRSLLPTKPPHFILGSETARELFDCRSFHRVIVWPQQALTPIAFGTDEPTLLRTPTSAGKICLINAAMLTVLSRASYTYFKNIWECKAKGRKQNMVVRQMVRDVKMPESHYQQGITRVLSSVSFVLPSGSCLHVFKLCRVAFL
ncbi:hypothetical protein ARMGADRAFT_1167003 [Armillaria gallica]|uniref:Uncharacterized protein n=1 Tax=Armillaria gallica TaxID=47427 RepID=A0A2H3D4A7_ARMGA|nr:hypothetical protein ARMGADRAFT_1167003 [Armillaria gallica]